MRRNAAVDLVATGNAHAGAGYSARNASTGLARTARTAGAEQAMSATMTTRAGTVARTFAVAVCILTMSCTAGGAEQCDAMEVPPGFCATDFARDVGPVRRSFQCLRT